MIKIKHLNMVNYQDSYMAMKTFTQQRDQTTDDELWLLQHPSVYTQGQAGKAEHILQPSKTPIVQSDRGGQVTYHGPGQLIVYTLINLRRYHLTIRKLVCLIEQSMISVLQNLKISAYQRNDAPGVYVDDAKIGSLGLRIRNGCAYHGLALNVDMDLTPFNNINPCGLLKQAMTQIRNYSSVSFETVEEMLLEEILSRLRRTTSLGSGVKCA